jgi:hypothetical protein
VDNVDLVFLMPVQYNYWNLGPQSEKIAYPVEIMAIIVLDTWLLKKMNSDF